MIAYKIQIPIDVMTEVGHYSDALYMESKDFFALTEAEVQALIDAKVNEWIAFVKASQTRVPAPDEENLLVEDNGDPNVS